MLAFLAAFKASKYFTPVIEIVKLAIPVAISIFLIFKVIGYVEEKGKTDVQIKLLQNTVKLQTDMIAKRDKIIEDDKKQKDQDAAKIRELEEDLNNALEDALNANPEQSQQPALPSDITKRLRDYWK